MDRRHGEDKIYVGILGVVVVMVVCRLGDGEGEVFVDPTRLDTLVDMKRKLGVLAKMPDRAATNMITKRVVPGAGVDTLAGLRYRYTAPVGTPKVRVSSISELANWLQVSRWLRRARKSP